MPQKGGHTGWILEVNEAMNRAMEGMGGEISKRYRIYELALGGAAGPPGEPGDSAKSANPTS
jgi:hypothetical protein